MTKYYFYTLNGEFLSGNLKETYDKLWKEEENYLKEGNIELYALCNRQRQALSRNREQFELQNGIDVRFLKRYGLKETTEESYNEIKTDDERIVSRFNDKTKKLLAEYGHSLDGWHFPFMIEAKDRSHLKWILRNKYPNFEIYLKNGKK